LLYIGIEAKRLFVTSMWEGKKIKREREREREREKKRKETKKKESRNPK